MIVRTFLAALLVAAPLAARAHAPGVAAGDPVGLPIPPLTHGETAIVARHQAAILALAARSVPGDATAQRLANYARIERALCLWGLAPGAVSDEDSPFNACMHAALAAAHALLARLAERPDGAAAKALRAQIAAEMQASDAARIVCPAGAEPLDTGRLVHPRWGDVPGHLPSALAGFGLTMTLVGAGWGARRAVRGSGA